MIFFIWFFSDSCYKFNSLIDVFKGNDGPKGSKGQPGCPGEQGPPGSTDCTNMKGSKGETGASGKFLYCLLTLSCFYGSRQQGDKQKRIAVATIPFV